jgi:hypothetical protein
MPDIVRILKKVHLTGLPVEVSDTTVSALKWGAIYYAEGNGNLLGEIAEYVLTQVDTGILARAQSARDGEIRAAQALVDTASATHHNINASAVIGFSMLESMMVNAQPRPAEWSDDYEQQVMEPEELQAIRQHIAEKLPWNMMPCVRVCAIKPVPHPDGAHTEDGDIIPSDGAHPAAPPTDADMQVVVDAFQRLVNEPSQAEPVTKGMEEENPGVPTQMDTLMAHATYRSSYRHRENSKWNAKYDENYRNRLHQWGPLEYARYIQAKGQSKKSDDWQTGKYEWSRADQDAFSAYIEKNPETGYAILVRVANKIHPPPNKKKDSTQSNWRANKKQAGSTSKR